MKLCYTDLDGSFLDHYTYSYANSLLGFALLKKMKIPLIFVSSKTFEEMRIITSELLLQSPFIFENGGGIAYFDSDNPEGYRCHLLGASPTDLQNVKPLIQGAAGSSCEFFDEISVDRICELTGLSVQLAQLSKKRKSSIPFLLHNDQCDISALNALLKPKGATITRGGRFYHLLSTNVSKGNAIKIINKYYRDEDTGERLITMGVGDSINDLSMLEVVDYPYLVRKYDGSRLEGVSFPVTDAIGPQGFSEAVKYFTEK